MTYFLGYRVNTHKGVAMTHWTDTIDTDGEWVKLSDADLKSMYQDSIKFGGYTQFYVDYLVEIVTHGDIVKVNGFFYAEV